MKQNIKTLQMLLWTMTILIQMTVVKCLEVRAETGETEELVIRHEIKERKALCQEPDQQYKVEAEETYQLKNWWVETVQIPEIRKSVEEVILYEEIEGTSIIPEEIEITSKTGDFRKPVSVMCSIKQKEILQAVWNDGFAFTVTFHTYGSGHYQLGDRLILYNEEQPELGDLEPFLLDEIGVPPEEYQISHVQWAGEPYLDEAGELCREAAAFGQKLVKDYRVTYQGIAVFPSQEGWQTVAIYERNRNSFEREDQTKAEISVIDLEETMGIPSQENALEPMPTLWEKITRTLILTIAVGAILFFGGLILLLFLRIEKKVRAWYNGKKEE